MVVELLLILKKIKSFRGKLLQVTKILDLATAFEKKGTES